MATTAAPQLGVEAQDQLKLSFIDLIISADFVVQVVIAILVIISIYCWTIMFDKAVSIRRHVRWSDQFENEFWSGGSLDQLFERIGEDPRDPLSAAFRAGMLEWKRSANRSVMKSDRTEALKTRIMELMQVVLGREIERLEKGLSFLATVASTAPFIGLFGTVWGIMNSFSSIAAAKQTSLAVVAPGIAEALFATALGLVAAIPATLGYNRYASLLGSYAKRGENFAVEFMTVVSRRLDEET